MMPKKRTSRGRTKGGKGSSGTVHCSQCGAMVPRDKAKKITGRITLVRTHFGKGIQGFKEHTWHLQWMSNFTIFLALCIEE